MASNACSGSTCRSIATPAPLLSTMGSSRLPQACRADHMAPMTVQGTRERNRGMAGWRQRLVETARRNRAELVNAGLTRRDLLQRGLLTSTGYLVTKLGLSARAAGAGGS